MEVKVTDSELSTDIESFTITVTSSTDKFLFVDTSDDGTPTGAIDDPYGSLDDFWTSDHTGKIVYFRSGTHIYPKTGVDWDRTIHRIRIEATNPIGYLGYPGETVTLNGEYSVGTAEESYCWYTLIADNYFQNIIFDNIYYYGISVAGESDRLTIYDCTFQNTYSDDDSHNQSSINYMSGNNHDNQIIMGNTFSSHQSGSNYHGVETYDVVDSVIQDNTFNGTGKTNVFIKNSTEYVAIRHNTFNGPTTSYGGIDLYGGVGHTDIEISFNLFKENFTVRSEDPSPATRVHIFRNTFLDEILFRSDTDASNVYAEGDFIIEDNVIQNDFVDSGSFPDFNSDHIKYDRFLEAEYDNLVAGMSDNVTGATSDNIVNTSGELQGSYRDTYLGVAGWEVAPQTGGACSGMFNTAYLY